MSLGLCRAERLHHLLLLRSSPEARESPKTQRTRWGRVHWQAIFHKACRDNRSVLYQRIPKLFADLALARGDGRYARIQRSLGGVQLLILDDWGLEPLDAAARHDLLEILEERYGRRSTIITSQIPVDKWHELIGEPTLS
jgi:DNA replication protein DnaC